MKKKHFFMLFCLDFFSFLNGKTSRYQLVKLIAILAIGFFSAEIKAQCSVTVPPVSICAGNTATITASGATTYTWDANAGGATTPTVTVTPSSSTIYTVTATTGTCTATQTVMVTVNTSTITIAPPVGTSTFCTNTPYQFTGNVNPGPIQSWLWTCNPSA